MQTVKNFDDINRELRNIQKFMDAFKGVTPFDLKGNIVKNASPGKDPTDLATVGQLPVVKHQTFTYVDYRTVLWSNPGVLYTMDGEDKVITDLEWYEFGRFLASKPIELWLRFVNPPTDGSCKVQLQYRLDDDATEEDILTEDLEVPQDSTAGVRTSVFTTPVKNFATRSCIRPRVIQHGEISVVSIGLVVERLL